MALHDGKSLRTVLLSVTALALLAGPALAATTGDKASVSSLIVKRKYQSAVSALTAQASKNDKNAQYKLGVMYRLGLGVPKDTDKAVYWLGKAAAAGHAKAKSLVQQLTFKPEPTVKKSAGAAAGAASSPAVTGVSYDKLPPRQKGQAEWLTFAAARNNSDAVTALLKTAGTDQATTADALSAAVANSSVNAIAVLVDHAASSTPASAMDLKLATDAINRGQSQSLAVLFQKHPDLVKTLANDKTSLERAVAMCDETVNAALAQSGALDAAGADIFVTATRYCTVPASDKLWSGLANVNAIDAEGRTALWYAAARGDEATVTALLDKGAAADVADAKGLTPLHVAAANGQMAIVKALLARTESLPAPAQDGTSVLMFAAYAGCTDCVSLIAEKTADIDEKNAAGNTALMLAVLGQHADTAKFLLSRGANANARNVGSDTPLKLAERTAMPLQAP